MKTRNCKGLGVFILVKIPNTWENERMVLMKIRELKVPVSITQQLPAGQVRYSQTSYVGEVSHDLTIEGSVDDVLKVLRNESITNIKLNIAPDINKDELGNVIEKAIEQAFSEEPALLL